MPLFLGVVCCVGGDGDGLEVFWGVEMSSWVVSVGALEVR